MKISNEGDEIVQASSKVEGTCKEDVAGSSPAGGALVVLEKY